MDPFQGLADFILGRLKQIGGRASGSVFYLSWGFLAVVSFLLICGVTLVSSNSWPFAIGSGMVTAAVVMDGRLASAEESSRSY